MLNNRPLKWPGLILFAIMVSLVGCVGLKPPVTHEGDVALASGQLHLLNGEYALMSADTSYVMLDYCMLGKQKFDFINKPGHGDRIRIEAMPKDRLKVTMLHGDEVVRQKRIKGELANGYYSFKASQLLPMVAINIYRHQEVRLGLNTEGSLVVQLAGTTVVFIVFVPVTGGKEEKDYLVFKRR